MIWYRILIRVHAAPPANFPASGPGLEGGFGVLRTSSALRKATPQSRRNCKQCDKWSCNDHALQHCTAALHDHAHCHMHCTLAYLTLLILLLHILKQIGRSLFPLLFSHLHIAEGDSLMVDIWHHHFPTTKWHVGIGASGTIKTLCRLALVGVLTWRKRTGRLLLGHSNFSCSRPGMQPLQITNHAKVYETIQQHIRTHYNTLQHTTSH